jgi:hypothetical protein
VPTRSPQSYKEGLEEVEEVAPAVPHYPTRKIHTFSPQRTQREIHDEKVKGLSSGIKATRKRTAFDPDVLAVPSSASTVVKYGFVVCNWN